MTNTHHVAVRHFCGLTAGPRHHREALFVCNPRPRTLQPLMHAWTLRDRPTVSSKPLDLLATLPQFGTAIRDQPSRLARKRQRTPAPTTATAQTATTTATDRLPDRFHPDDRAVWGHRNLVSQRVSAPKPLRQPPRPESTRSASSNRQAQSPIPRGRDYRTMVLTVILGLFVPRPCTLPGPGNHPVSPSRGP